MSAFVGVINLAGEPVDRAYLDNMADYLTTIGPDRRRVVVEPGIGIVHALHKTTPADIDSFQPLVTDRYMVVGDVRLDGRAELVRRLAGQGIVRLERQQDIELVLQAWLVWGNSVAEYLLGDFSLAIWDKLQRRLFCLRDQFGIRQFFYTRNGSLFLFSNVLNCLSQHASISSQLNDEAVVDFLVLSFSSNPAATIYRDIHRLAPAHILEVSSGSVSTRRYWNLPVDPELKYRNTHDYVDHFGELLEQAVAERLGAGPVGVSMSGGLDSTAVAAFAHKARGDRDRLCLYTQDIKSLWPEDQEADYAALVAAHLGAPHHVNHVMPDELFEREQVAGWALPEPSREGFRLSSLAVLRQMAGNHRAALTGQGADPLLLSSPMYFNELLATRQLSRFLADLVAFYRVHHHRPPLYLRAGLKGRYERAPRVPALPVWLLPEMAKKTGVLDRLMLATDPTAQQASARHPRRDVAYQNLCSPMWPDLLARYESQTTGLPLEFSHPFLDLRLVRFALSMPPSPWFHNKALLRSAAEGVLPEQVRLRSKAIPGTPPAYRGLLVRGGGGLVVRLLARSEVSCYIDVRQFGKMVLKPDKLRPDESDLIALPVALSDWLEMR